MPQNTEFPGLSDEQVIKAREQYGSNHLDFRKRNGFLEALKSLAKEPMILLLLVTATVYFIIGDIGDGIFLSAATVLVAAISLFQDARSRNALAKLSAYTHPRCKVIRDGKPQDLDSADLVIGDYIIVVEGTSIPADAVIVQSNDFSVDESILTGESFAVFKDNTKEDKTIYQGTIVASGRAIATVTAIGKETSLGKIGQSLNSIEEEPTPLERQINNFVKKMVIAGAIVILIVWAINYFRSYDFADSLLKALTLAMSILPEEIPVAFTTFMALGAWRLMKIGILVKQMKTVETLGSATVICTDKTGTLTENKMTLARLYTTASNKISPVENSLTPDENQLIRTAMWASEPVPFDPMEVALHNAYGTAFKDHDERLSFTLVHEYPLDGKPPMMTHVFEDKGSQKVIAAKGAPEAIMAVCNLSDTDKQSINAAMQNLTREGFRVLGVAVSTFQGNDYPAAQQSLPFTFQGLVGFYDPPKQNIKAVLDSFYQAGIQVKIVTGDNAETTASIAKQVGFEGHDNSITGDELMELTDNELQHKVSSIQVFSRMFPEAKLRIINALKANHEIVAMTGDGVNDGPALKAAHIGIAMGKKGTEIAKEAASLILVDDDLSKMVDAVAMGRRIYTNLKKAIQYIISIHIPIILTVFIPLALGWIYPNIFTPVHIIFLELIMGPTCSIIYENEPIEKNTMKVRPRPFTSTFFNARELTTSIIQGLVITAGTLIVYQISVYHGHPENLTRAMVFTTLIVANILLTLINRSFFYSILTTIRYRNNLVLWITSATVVITAALLYIPPLARFFKFEPIPFPQLMICVGIGIASVIWFELVKWRTRLHDNRQA